MLNASAVTSEGIVGWLLVEPSTTCIGAATGNSWVGSEDGDPCSFAPMWVGSLASLCIIHHILGLADDVLWVWRALAVDSKRQHVHWTKWHRIHARLGRCINRRVALTAQNRKQRAYEEFDRMLLYPLRRIFSYIASFGIITLKTICSLGLVRLHSAFLPRRRLLRCVGRLIWLVLLVVTYGTKDPMTGPPIFMFLALVQAVPTAPLECFAWTAVLQLPHRRPCIPALCDSHVCNPPMRVYSGGRCPCP